MTTIVEARLVGGCWCSLVGPVGGGRLRVRALLRRGPGAPAPQRGSTGATGRFE